MSLPTSLAANILDSWLCMADRGRLDSAHCQVSVRKGFLELIRTPELSVKTWVYDKGPTKTTNSIVLWANNRCVSVDRLSVNGTGNLNLYNQYLQRFAEGVLCLQLHNTSLSRFATSISRCSNLLALSAFNCEVISSLRDVLTSCKNLRDLRFEYNFEFNTLLHPCTIKSADLQGLSFPNIKVLFLNGFTYVRMIMAMLQLATELEVLEISICGNEGEPDICLIDRVLSKIPTTVTTLSLPGMVYSSTDLSAVAARLPYLQNLSLRFCTVSDYTAEDIGAWKHLTHLDISGSTVSYDELVILADMCGDRLTELHLYDCGCMRRFPWELLSRFTELTTFSTYCNVVSEAYHYSA